MIFIIGVSNMVVWFVVGFVIDRLWVNFFVINNFVLMIGGIMIFVVFFYNSFVVLIMYSIVFGVFIGVYV